jgi:hypothetical protein
VFRRHVARSAGRMRRRHIERSRHSASAFHYVTRQFARKAISISAERSAFQRMCPVGFKQIRLNFDLDTDASDEQIANLTSSDRTLLRRLPNVESPAEISVLHRVISR